jgi:hypothetical protein
MLDINLVQAIIAGAVIIGGIAFLVWYMRRDRRFREYRREDEAKREAQRQKHLAELSQEGKLLYQLVERTDDLIDVQKRQGRKLNDISLGVGIIETLLVLSAIAGCLVGVFGVGLSGLV